MNVNIYSMNEKDALEVHLHFEKLVSQVASHYVVPTEKPLDLVIKDSLQTITEFCGVDRCCVALFSENGKSLQVTHTFSAARKERLKNPKHLTNLPLYVKELSRGKPVILERIPQDVPWHVDEEIQPWPQGKMKSHLGLPIANGADMIGALMLDSFHTIRQWPPYFIEHLERVCTLLAGAIMRKETNNKFNNLFQFEIMLSEISSVFANLLARDIDTYIDFGLERIGRFLNADRCDYAYFDRGDVFAQGRIYSWGNKGIKPLPALKDLDRLWPWTKTQILKGKTVHFTRVEELPTLAEKDKATWRRIETKSHVNVPISIGGPIVGALSVTAVRKHRSWPKEIVPRLRLVGEVFSNALVRKKKEFEVMAAFDEIKELKTQIEADCTYLREEIDLTYGHHNMIGQSDAFKKMILRINQIANTDTTVLICGETGTGKEMVARAIHANSRRKNRPMVKVNCAALSQNLIESELFGHKKGAFTGAHETRIGRFELANGNTLFMDEIGELPIESQGKLLRVLQEGEFERLGSSDTLKVDVRIIAATNRNLEAEIENLRFRQDLWYRLNIFPIEPPPLRHRKEDIPLLSDWFTRKFSKKLGKPIEKIPASVMKILQNYHWPGNVRELENVIERAVINSPGSILQLIGPLSSVKDVSERTEKRYTLDEIQKEYILKILEETKWRVHGPKGAAAILGINPSTLRGRMRKLSIM